MTSTSSSTFYPKPSSCETTKTIDTPETDKTSFNNYSNDITQSLIPPEYPSKSDMPFLNNNHPPLPSQSPISFFYSKKIIPNPFHNQLKSLSLSKNNKTSSSPHKTPIKHNPLSHVCISYKEKPKQTNYEPSNKKFLINKHQFVISCSNMNEHIIKKKFPQYKCKDVMNETNELIDNMKEGIICSEGKRKIIKITNSMKEEVVAKQQLNEFCENEGMRRFNTMRCMSYENSGIKDKERIVKLKRNDGNKCGNNYKLCYNVNKPTTPLVGTSAKKENSFFMQNNKDIINNHNISNNKFDMNMQTYCDNITPIDNNQFHNNSPHNITIYPNETIIQSHPYQQYNSLNAYSSNENVYNKLFFKRNISTTLNNSINPNKNISNLNQSCSIHNYSSNNVSSTLQNNKSNSIIDNYVKNTLMYINQKSLQKQNIKSKKNSSLVKHINKIKPGIQQIQIQGVHKKKKYIQNKQDCSITSRSPCDTKTTNSFLIKNKIRTKLNAEHKEAIRSDRKEMKSYVNYCRNKMTNKDDNVFLKLHSQIYHQLTQDK